MPVYHYPLDRTGAVYTLDTDIMQVTTPLSVFNGAYVQPIPENFRFVCSQANIIPLSSELEARLKFDEIKPQSNFYDPADGGWFFVMVHDDTGYRHRVCFRYSGRNE